MPFRPESLYIASFADQALVISKLQSEFSSLFSSSERNLLLSRFALSETGSRSNPNLYLALAMPTK